MQEIKKLKEEITRLKASSGADGDLEYSVQSVQEEIDLLKTVLDIIVDIILKEDQKNEENISEQKIQKGMRVEPL